MAFPTTSALEAFTGSNGADLDADWTALSGAAMPKINGNAASNVLAANPYVGAWWDPSTFGPDSEVYVTQSAGGDYFGLFARLTTPTGSYDAYELSWSGSSLTAQRVDNTVQTQLGATVTLAKTTGTKAGLEVIGTTIKLYADTGSGWVERASRTDSTYTTAGNIGFDYFDSASPLRLDDFGGGTVVAGGTTYERSAAVAATAAIAASGTFWTTFARSTALAATGAITVPTFRRDRLRSASLAATAAITTAGQRDLLRAASLASTAAITTAGEIEAPGATTHERSASLSSTAAITAAGTFYSILARAVALNATAAITSAPQRALLRSAAISATAAVTAAGQIEGGAATHERAAALSASAAITAAATFWSVLERASALTATAAVTVAYRRELQRQDAVTATGAITIAHQRYLNRTAVLTAASLITTGWQIGEIPDVLLYLAHREHAALTHTERAHPVFREHAHLTLRR